MNMEKNANEFSKEKTKELFKMAEEGSLKTGRKCHCKFCGGGYKNEEVSELDK